MDSLKAENISFKPEDGKSGFLFENLNLGISEGSVNLITGDSGSGKSSFIKVVLGLNKPTEGRILLDGKPLEGESLRNFRLNSAYIPQEYPKQNITVREVFLKPFTLNIRKSEKYPEDSEITKKLSEFYLQGVDLDFDSSRLSVGQGIRLSIAVASFLNPEIYFMDEPFSALDPKSAQMLLQWMENQTKNGVKFVIIDHSGKIINHFTELKQIKFSTHSGKGATVEEAFL